MDKALAELEDELAARPDRILVLMGAGVSASVTKNAPCASWKGLLLDGLDHCASHCPNLPAGWLDLRKRQLEEATTSAFMHVATEVASRLKGMSEGEFGLWLSRTIGKLDPLEPGIIAAVLDWGVQICTTNYDSLIEKVGRREPITWQDRGLAGEFLRGDNRDVLHLHGLWRKPDSVILDFHSYENIIRDAYTQAHLRATLLTRTLVFVGCGAGLEDPNFGTLMDWSKDTLSQSHHRHYRLARERDCPALRTFHAGMPIRVVSYGDDYNDLPRFLAEISARLQERHKPAPSPIERLVRMQAEFVTAIRELETQKSAVPPEVFANRLFQLATQLSDAGGSKTAASYFVQLFQNEAKHLDVRVRLRMGADAIEMLLRDDQPDEAGHIMQEVSAELPATEDDHKLNTRLRDLFAQCLNQLGYYEAELEALDDAISNVTDPAAKNRFIAQRTETRLLRGNVASEVSGDK